ncbi:hypothetical protein AB0O57_32435 [Streptomyces sp. NPDC091201]|uniref:hypothetical protein n=1 Tax=Streptomyces sp. NPDC091201 TaxID=3155190 RepID=UPI003413C3EB
MIDFLREHQTLLLLLFPVVTAFVGSWLGAWIQARGGMAQAKAALAAAETSAAAANAAAETAAAAALSVVQKQAEADHATYLRGQCTTAISGLLDAVREYVRAVDKTYSSSETDPLDQAYSDFVHARTTIELVAPAVLASATARVVTTAELLADLAEDRSAAERARQRLDAELLANPVAVARARNQLSSLQASCDAAGDGLLPPQHREVSTALLNTGILEPPAVAALIVDCLKPDLDRVRAQLTDDHQLALRVFITAARATLGVRD